MQCIIIDRYLVNLMAVCNDLKENHIYTIETTKESSILILNIAKDHCPKSLPLRLSRYSSHFQLFNKSEMP